MTSYVTNSKDYTHTHTQIQINKCQAAGHKVNTQKSVAFLYTDNQ